MATNAAVKAALLARLGVSPQRPSQIVKKRKAELPMTTERRLRNAALAERAVLIDKAFLDETTAFLRAIVERLASVVGPSLLTRWFREAAARDWGRDEIDYCRIKLLTTYIQSRPTELPVVDEASYTGDLHRYG